MSFNLQSLAAAHFVASTDLDATISKLSTTSVAIGSVLLIILVFIAVVAIKPEKSGTGKTKKKNPPQKIKAPLFAAIVVTIVAVTGIISGATIYLNLKSATGGPVHWHADFEIWACGNELELRDPQGALSNKIGTPTLHEHNDKRIHLEGVPVELPHDASLGKFMEVIGGEVSSRSLIVPLNESNYFANTHETQDGDGSGAPRPGDVQPFVQTGADGTYARFVNGERCGNQQAQVQLFTYRYDDATKTYHQTKISNPSDYEIAHHSQVPPGDCLIVEFAPAKDRTDKLCKQYGVRDTDRCESFGVDATERKKVCDIQEVR